jgi:porin
VGIVCLAAVAQSAVVYGQEPTAPSLLTPSADVTAAQAPPAKPAQAPEPDVLHRNELTGDWNGARTQWKNKGVELESSLTQFYQGVASGGVETGSEYNGTAQARLKFDLGKLAGWQWWSAEVKAEMRFGGPLLGGTGAINPVNTMAIIPGADGTVFSVSAVNFTKIFPVDLKKGELFAVSFGRYNLVDLIDEDFFAGGGTERFMNIAQIGPLTVLRQVPLITNAVNLIYIRAGEPYFTFSLMDPNDHSTDPGLENLFTDGVTFAPAINFPAKYFGKSAKHTFGGAITTKAYTPFDAIRQIIIPGSPLVPIEPKRGSWSGNYIFRQYIVERGKRDGWGLFGQVSCGSSSRSTASSRRSRGWNGTRR